MQIDVNGLLLDSETATGIKLLPPVSGLETPPVRMSADDFSGRDGGYVSSQYYSSRVIVMRGQIDGRSCSDADEMRCMLLESLPIRQVLPFALTTDSDLTYVTDTYFRDLKMEYESNRWSTFELTLVAPDSNFYLANPDDPESGWIEQEFEEILGGGYITPYVLPVIWEGSSQPTLIDNPTSSPLLPQIVLEGKYTNPRITNNTTGQYIELAVTTAPGDIIIIDMKERSVTLNGGSILPTKSGSWWSLMQGTNSISLLTGSNTDTKTGIIRYRPAYTGIFGGIC